MKGLAYHEALEMILAQCAPCPAEEVPLAAAPGRVLHAPLLAAWDDPPSPKSGMDGFAIRAGDTAPASPADPVRLPYARVTGAGHGLPPPLPPGGAMRAMTGALLPPGADCVLKWEDATWEGVGPETPAGGAGLPPGEAPPEGVLLITRPLQPGEHVIPPGRVLRAGQTLIPAGRVLDGQGLALLAGQGQASCTVRRRPRLALLALGDELVPPGQPLGPGQIYVSNLQALAAIAARHGADPVSLGIAPDDPQVITGLLREALEGAQPPDVVVTLGGSLHGAFDFAGTVQERLGARQHFRNTRLNMGGSTLFASRGGQLFFGLSGAPMASWVAYEVLVRPALWRMLGRQPAERPQPRARLTEPLPLRPQRTHFIPARLDFAQASAAEPLPTVTPLARGTPVALPPALLANGLIHWAEDAPPPEPGGVLPVEWLDIP